MKRLTIGMAILAWSAPAHAQNPTDLARADVNGDGRITRAEFDALREAGFDRLDTDDDGLLSAEEKQAAGRMAQRLAAADANRDGQISRAEFIAQPPRAFVLFDGDHNNTLDENELSRLRQAMRRFGG